MSVVKRTNEEGHLLNCYVEQWNSHMHGYQITLEHLQKLKPMFLIESFYQIFNSLGLAWDDIIQISLDCVDMDKDVVESLSRLAPLVTLTEAVNTLLTGIWGSNLVNVDLVKITPFDLITPSQTIILTVLRFLLNYLIFVEGREQEAQEREREVQELAAKYESLLRQKDALEDDLHQIHIEEASRDQRMKQLEVKIKRLTVEPVEHQEKIEELDRQLKTVQMKNRQLLATQETQQVQQMELRNQLTRLRSCVVSDEEQQEVMRAREKAEERQQEVRVACSEADASLWACEASIKTLGANLAHIHHAQLQLDAIVQLLGTIGEVERLREDDSGEADLQCLRTDKLELLRCLEELRGEHAAWQVDADKAEREAAAQLHACISEDKKSEQELEQAREEVDRFAHWEEERQSASLRHDKEREMLLRRYTIVIPTEFQDAIQNRIENIKAILNNTLRRKCDHN